MVQPASHPATEQESSLRRTICSHADEAVAFAGNLRTTEHTWQEALATWLDGRILCQETKRYVGNFMAVHRVRPGGDDSDSACSDDMVSDEELEVTHASIEAALATRVGGHGRGDDEEGKAGSHRENSSTGMSLAQSVWTPDKHASSDFGRARKKQPSGLGLAESELSAVLDEAKKSQRREKSLTASVKDAEERGVSLRCLTSATADDVQRWLDELKVRRNKEGRLKGRLVCNPEQYAAVEKIAIRVIRELNAESLGAHDYGEPLRWVVHGGPGTGKSHVIKLIKKELFQDVLKWDLGVQFQVVALQAVMAELLGGDTIHHALGIPVFKGKEAHERCVIRCRSR